MLEQIAKIKQKPFEIQFHYDDINDISTLLQSAGFISRSRPQVRFSQPVTISNIRTPSELEEIAKNIDSCLYNPYKKDQLEAYARFLDDPGALYFSFNSHPYVGYFRFYAGKRIKSEETVLFEDVLRTRNVTQEKKTIIYHPECKAIVLKIVEAIDMLDESYLYVPLRDVDSYDGKQLRIRKIGSSFFKKGFGDWFYDGRPTEEGWPRFENARELLEM